MSDKFAFEQDVQRRTDMHFDDVDDKITFKTLYIIFRMIQIITFNIISKSTGYIAIFELNKPTN